METAGSSETLVFTTEPHVIFYKTVIFKIQYVIKQLIVRDLPNAKAECVSLNHEVSNVKNARNCTSGSFVRIHNVVVGHRSFQYIAVFL
jgi:hypothetical protein